MLCGEMGVDKVEEEEIPYVNWVIFVKKKLKLTI